jgi:hypothetical protein
MNTSSDPNNDVSIVALLCQEKIPAWLGFAIYRVELS